MGADDRGVDHHVFGVGIAGQVIQYTIENAALAPSAETLVRAFPGTKMRRQIAPGNARPIAIENRVDEKNDCLAPCRRHAPHAREENP